MLLKTSEVATRLRCSRETVRALCESGKLRASRLGDGGNWRVSEFDLADFLNGNTSETEPAKPTKNKPKRTIIQTPELDRLMKGKR